jgi:bifunctional non-homologous end joining protein LigD
MKESLYFNNGASDKEYHIEMLPQGSGFVVNISYGRCGGILQSGTKTASPVTQVEAKKLFDKTVNAKLAKGYAPKQSNPLTYATTAKAKGIAPMLCQKMLPNDAAKLSSDWVIEKKFDGIRAVIKDGRLWCRRGNDITHKFPEFVGLSAMKQTYDGEIVAQSGEFNDMSGRVHMKDKFAISLVAKKNPVRFMAFDLPDAQGDNVSRRQMLVKTKCPVWLGIAEQFSIGEFYDLWQEILENTEEGIVVKRNDTQYVEGKRASGWRKVKAFLETTAVFVKYEVHPKGLTIETADGRRVVVNGGQASGVKAILDRDGKVTAEVQYLPQKDSDAWRFPSFRGVV